MLLSITEGDVIYKNETIPRNSTIEVKIKLTPHAFYYNTNQGFQMLTTLKTEFIENNTYKIIPPDEPWLIYYPYSGQKYMISILYVDGIEMREMESVEIIEIEKGFIKSQVEAGRFSVILTFWIISFTMLPIANKIITWFIRSNPSKFMDD